MEDINKVIEDNIKLVYRQLHKFNMIDDADALSFALEGLANAALTYNKDKGYSFSTYACTCIYNAVSCYIRSVNKKHKLQLVYYEDYVSDTDKSIQYKDTLTTGRSLEDDYVAQERVDTIWEAFDCIVNSMPDSRSRIVIEYWKDSNFTATQTDIANETGISQSYVSRILSAFKHKLKKELEERLC